MHSDVVPEIAMAATPCFRVGTSHGGACGGGCMDELTFTSTTQVLYDAAVQHSLHYTYCPILYLVYRNWFHLRSREASAIRCYPTMSCVNYDTKSMTDWWPKGFPTHGGLVHLKQNARR
jgi:hypothetical protein